MMFEIEKNEVGMVIYTIDVTVRDYFVCIFRDYKK